VSATRARTGVWEALDRRLGGERTDDRSLDLWERLEERVDPAEFHPKLAGDIEIKEFSPRRGNDYVVIRNPRDLNHLLLQPEDYDLMKMMDGTRSVKEMVFERFQEQGEVELSSVIDLVHLLYIDNFLDRTYVDLDKAVRRAIKPVSTAREKARGFAKTLTVEWKNADRLPRWLYRHGFDWFYKRWVVALCLVFSLAGLVLFVREARSHSFPLAGRSLALGFLVLFVLDYFWVFAHELGHALAVVHYGRRIKSVGFQIYFGAPAFFVESSDVLMLDPHQRMLSSFAGPYAQMLVAAASSFIVWAFPGWILAPTFYKYAVLNYLVLMLNLMPMLELDGYFILSDILQMPELRTKSLEFVRHDLLFKLRTRERFSRGEVGLALYGILGVLFTIGFLFWHYIYWKSIFGAFVSRMWNSGTITRILLIALGVFLVGPVVRAGFKVLRSVGRRVLAAWVRIRFRLEQKWRVEAAELIDALPLFREVPADALNDLAGRVHLRSFSAGQPIVRQGDRATAFWVIRKGTLEVVEENHDTGESRVIRTLERGESFGELGLIEGTPRTATVRSVGESQLFEVEKGTFDRLLADTVEAPQLSPTLHQLAELGELPSFAHLGADQLLDVLAHGEWVNLAPGEVLMEQGQPGEAFYAIGAGQVEVLVDGEPVRTVGRGGYVGELALLFDMPRTATVRAVTPVRAFRLDREGFDRLVADAFRKEKLRPAAEVDRTLRH